MNSIGQRDVGAVEVVEDGLNGWPQLVGDLVLAWARVRISRDSSSWTS
jgi:hypothetical protein